MALTSSDAVLQNTQLPQSHGNYNILQPIKVTNDSCNHSHYNLYIRLFVKYRLSTLILYANLINKSIQEYTLPLSHFE